MKTVGVVLAGCGYLDGTEIQEAVLTLLALDRAKADAVCMAPDIEQFHVMDHLKGEGSAEKRNALVEAARIPHGKKLDIKAVRGKDLDALIIPGGFGVAKNLCTYAIKGIDCNVHPEVVRIVQEIADAKKPIGALCISPVLIAKILGSRGVRPILTIGTDEATANDICIMGGKHQKSSAPEVVVDRKNKIVSTPAYMVGPSIAFVAKGIEKLVREVLRMTRKKRN